MKMLVAYVVVGYFFYAAPHIVWAFAATFAKASRVVWHEGFIASSVALGVIAGFWLGPQDPSGLPLQWMLYWPLSAVLQLAIAGGAAVYRRAKRVADSSAAADA
jgi:hypothetical protein